MSNRLFQGMIHQMKDSVDRVIGVVDEQGVVISCSELTKIGDSFEGVNLQTIVSREPFVCDNYTLKAFGTGEKFDYAVFVGGNDDLAESYVGLLSISLTNIKQYHDEKYDRGNFIKNVILDNILPGDVYVKARELHFGTDANRIVLLVRTSGFTEVSAYDIIAALFPDRQKDFVFNISDTDTVIVKEITQEIELSDVEKLAKSIVDTLQGEYYMHSFVGIGTAITGIRELAKSFKEAQVALEVFKVFDSERTIVSFESLGVARLIYQLPTTVCEQFLREVFKRGSIELLDQETLFTIQRFFENNLNVSETSRGLFVHRNTLVYRLEKIKKLTGLDLREFDDAIVFKVALMVKKYLSSNPVKY